MTATRTAILRRKARVQDPRGGLPAFRDAESADRHVVARLPHRRTGRGGHDAVQGQSPPSPPPPARSVPSVRSPPSSRSSGPARGRRPRARRSRSRPASETRGRRAAYGCRCRSGHMGSIDARSGRRCAPGPRPVRSGPRAASTCAGRPRRSLASPTPCRRAVHRGDRGPRGQSGRPAHPRRGGRRPGSRPEAPSGAM